MILNLYTQEQSYSASKYNEGYFTIRSVIKRFCNRETVINALRCGLEKLSVREIREIINTVKKKNPPTHRRK